MKRITFLTQRKSLKKTAKKKKNLLFFLFHYECELHFNCLNRNFIYFSPEMITYIISSSHFLGSGQKLNFCRKTFPLSDCKLNEDEWIEEGGSIALLCKTVSNLSFLQKILTFFELLPSFVLWSYVLLPLMRLQGTKRHHKWDRSLDVHGKTTVLKLMGSTERKVPQAAMGIKGHLLSFCRKKSSAA